MANISQKKLILTMSLSTLFFLIGCASQQYFNSPKNVLAKTCNEVCQKNGAVVMSFKEVSRQHLPFCTTISGKRCTEVYRPVKTYKDGVTSWSDRTKEVSQELNRLRREISDLSVRSPAIQKGTAENEMVNMLKFGKRLDESCLCVSN